METKGKNYQKEFEEIMYDNDFIKPWSLSGFRTNPISLDCALEEIANIWEEDARFREGFLIDKENNVVNIPHLYVRIKGIKTKFGDNDADMGDLIKTFNTNSLHINMESNPSKNENLFAKHIQEKLDNNEDLDVGDIPNNGWFHKLNETIQIYILGKLNHFARGNKGDYDIPSLVKTLGFIDKDFAQALNDWQFYNKVPKVFVKDVDGLSLQVLEWLDFLSFLGFDIMVFSPMGELLPQKENHYKDMKVFTLDKFEMEYKEYNEGNSYLNEEEKYYADRLDTLSYITSVCNIFTLLFNFICSIFFILEYIYLRQLPDYTFLIKTTELGPIVLIALFNIPTIYKVKKFAKQNKEIKAFNKVYYKYLNNNSFVITLSMIIFLLVITSLVLIKLNFIALLYSICLIVYIIIFIKNKKQIKNLAKTYNF
jgi:hypothetical protein